MKTADINTVLLNIDNDETGYYSITHPNHSAILLVHNRLGDNEFSQPQKCYNNWNENSKDGSITRFNDNVFNTNITLTVKDSTSINDQNLIQNLDPGLYNVKKQFNDGTIEESNIFKNNQ